MNIERKIEGALEDWFRQDGWYVKEHIAEYYECDEDCEISVEIDLTALSKRISEDIKC